MKRPGRWLVIRQNPHEATILDRTTKCIFGGDQNAGSCDSGRFERRTAVCLQTVFHFYRIAFTVARKPPSPFSGTGAVGVTEAIMVHEIGGRAQRSARAQIGRRGACHEPIPGEWPLHEGRIGKFSDPEHSFKPFLNKVYKSISQYKVDLDLRIACEIARQERYEAMSTKRDRGADP